MGGSLQPLSAAQVPVPYQYRNMRPHKVLQGASQPQLQLNPHHNMLLQYVFKYTFKSPDFTAISVDEISAHLSGRLLSVSEAVHRLLSLPLHKEWPPVVRLHVHLPHQQNVVFDPTVDEQTLITQLYSTTSTLMAWFELNTYDLFARNLFYHELPEFYTWAPVANGGSWSRRIRNKIAVGRMFSVSPQNVELHCLRRLLSVVKGACSFQDLATVVRSHACSICF
jgi:hypothetical protein